MNRLHQLLSQPKATRWFVKDLMTGALYLDDQMVGLSVPRSSEQSAAKVWLKAFQFPAASERVTPPPGREDVTRRGDSSCRGVPASMIGESGRSVPPGELSGEAL